VKCFAIKADEMNDNGDYFPRHELKNAVPTFVGVPVFTNHQNNDINQARGKVVYSWWDDEKDGIMIIARVDAEAYPTLARGIKENYIGATSMGCNVKYSLCSICHNYAETPDQFCGHIKERKTRTVEAKNQKCEYHKNGNEGQCPICGCGKGETKKFAVNQKVFEYNYGIKFIENSFVVNPACHSCGVTEVIDPQIFLSKISDVEKRLPILLEAASKSTLTCTDTCIPVVSSKQKESLTNALSFLKTSANKMDKLAGQAELDQLNQALQMLSSVSESMLKQRDQIDLEFLSDLVKVLADLQTVSDELTEQGYGRLPSPTGEAQPQQPGQETPTPPAAPAAAPATPVNPTPGGGSKITNGPAGPVGSVTSPSASKKLDLTKMGIIKQAGNVLKPKFSLRNKNT
jgi:hypothetical protein